MFRLLLALPAVVLVAALLPTPAPAQVGCLSQAETVAAVRDGKVLAYDEAVPRRLRDAGDFLGVRLCADQGILVYVVSTLTGSGRVTHTAVDAKSGRIVGKR